MRALLGYSYAHCGDWQAAVETYRALPKVWESPQLTLCLAEAEMHAGNLEEANRILVGLEVGHAQTDRTIALNVERLSGELKALLAGREAA